MTHRYHYLHCIITRYTKYHVYNNCSINATVLNGFFHRNSFFIEKFHGMRQRTVIYLYSILRHFIISFVLEPSYFLSEHVLYQEESPNNTFLSRHIFSSSFHNILLIPSSSNFDNSRKSSKS